MAGPLRVTRSVVVPERELRWRFSRSSGPGGQSVNTADSRVELGLDLTTTAALGPVQRARVLGRLSTRLVDGVLTVTASEHRSQLRNREAARERLAASPRRRARAAASPTSDEAEAGRGRTASRGQEASVPDQAAASERGGLNPPADRRLLSPTDGTHRVRPANGARGGRRPERLRSPGRRVVRQGRRGPRADDQRRDRARLARPAPSSCTRPTGIPESTPHFAKDGGIWPVHCVKDTWGAEFHADLDVDGPVVRKGSNGEDGYSGFSMRDARHGGDRADRARRPLARARA